MAEMANSIGRCSDVYVICLQFICFLTPKSDGFVLLHPAVQVDLHAKPNQAMMLFAHDPKNVAAETFPFQSGIKSMNDVSGNHVRGIPQVQHPGDGCQEQPVC